MIIIAYFNAELLPNPQNGYVAFIDIMGIRSFMYEDYKIAGNFLVKFHAVVLEELRKCGYKEEVSLFPVMDGIYITTERKDVMERLLVKIFRNVAVTQAQETNNKYIYFIRAGIAYGKSILGRDIPYTASLEFANCIGYKENLLVGIPAIAAYTCEKEAAPMGIYLDASVQNGKRHWKWFEENKGKIEIDRLIIGCLADRIQEYYNWLASNSQILPDYEEGNRKVHFTLAQEYFDGYFSA